MLLLGVALLGVVAFLARERVLDFFVLRFAEGVLGDSPLLHDDALHVVLCGTAGPVAGRDQRSACNAIVADGELLLVDAGGGGALLAGALGLPLRQLSTILVTHLHHDHVGGIADAIHGSWFVGRTRPVTVYGPPGVDALVRGLELAFAEDRRLRALRGGGSLDPSLAQPAVRVIEVANDEAVPVLERGRLRVRAFRVDHGPIEPALGYRVDFAGRSAVFNGDGRADVRTVRHAEGADLLVNATVGFRNVVDPERVRRVVEQVDPDFPDAARVLTLFSSPVEIARVAQEAGVGTLVYSHHPPIPWGAGPVFLWGVSSAYDGRIHVGREGMRFDFPARTGR